MLPAEALVYRITQPGTYYACRGKLDQQCSSAAGDYLLSISLNGSAGPTAVKLSPQEASQMKARFWTVLLNWRRMKSTTRFNVTARTAEGGSA
jgi:hypothetical protein